MGDPAKVYERLQEQQQRKHAKTRQGKQERARAGLEDLFKGEDMTQDESEQIEDLLETWYRYEAAYMPALGGPKVSPSCRGHTPDMGDVYATNDERDAKLEKATAEAVAACVDELHYLERAAINLHMRNKIGPAVYRNPHLGDIEESHAKYQTAKGKLWPMLKRRGMVRR